jgi:hypothetical protein
MTEDPIAIMQAAQLPPDATPDDMAVALASALAALKLAKPSNDAVARQIAGARKQAVKALKGAA